MKGEPRKRTAEGRRLRQLAARIPNREVFDGFIAATPEALRAQVRREIVPYLRFCLTNHFDVPTGNTCPQCGKTVLRDNLGKEIHPVEDVIERECSHLNEANEKAPEART